MKLILGIAIGFSLSTMLALASHMSDFQRDQQEIYKQQEDRIERQRDRQERTFEQERQKRDNPC